MKITYVFLFLANLIFSNIIGFSQENNQEKLLSEIENSNYKLSFYIADGKLYHEYFELKNPTIPNSALSKLTNDGNFSIEINEKQYYNAEKPYESKSIIVLKKNDFVLIKHFKTVEKTGQNYTFEYKSVESLAPIYLKISYSLENEAFYYRKQIQLIDSANTHFLIKFSPLNSYFSFSYEFEEDAKTELGNNLMPTVVKSGGFGQPVAFNSAKRGMFAGVEHPASVNTITNVLNELISVDCSHFIGLPITEQPIITASGVVALASDTNIEKWFYTYVSKISISKPTPFVIFESPPVNEIVKNKNTEVAGLLQLFDFLKLELKDKQHIKFDAFLMDADLLSVKNQTVLLTDKAMQSYTGLGYKLKTDQLLANPNTVRELVELITNYDINYLEFSGLGTVSAKKQSDSAVWELAVKTNLLLQATAELHNSKPNIHMHIGKAWLSSWWLMHTNWVGTNFVPENNWFPMANAEITGFSTENTATHLFNSLAFRLNTETGLLKISLLPESLTSNELQLLSEYINLFLKQPAANNSTKPVQGVFDNSAMIGFYQPANQAIKVVLHNSSFTSKSANVSLASLGITQAGNWFVERTYPTREILRKILTLNDTADFTLNGYETAVFVISRIEDAKRPLLSGVIFETIDNLGNFNKINLLKQTGKVSLLNPETVNSVYYNSSNIDKEITDFGIIDEEIYQNLRFNSEKTKKGIRINANCTVSPSVSKMQAYFLIETASGTAFLPAETDISLLVSEVKTAFIVEKISENKLLIKANAANNSGNFDLQIKTDKTWQGRVEVWLSELTDAGKNELTFECAQVVKEPRMLPKPFGNSKLFNLKKYYEAEFK